MMYIQFNACIFNAMHVYSITVLVPALPVVSVSELFPELSLIVTATGKETCASLFRIISCHLSGPIGSKISYFSAVADQYGTTLFKL